MDSLAATIVLSGLASLSLAALFLMLSHFATARTGLNPHTGKASMLGRRGATLLAYAHAVALAALAAAWVSLLDKF